MSKFIYAALGALLFAQTSHANKHVCVQPLYVAGGEVVTLVGILNRTKEWGPPNFGESPQTDAKIEMWSVALPNAISFSVQESGQQSMIRPKRIQITVSPSRISRTQLLALSEHVVSVKGRLWPATSAGDYTSITIDPIEVESSVGKSSEVMCF